MRLRTPVLALTCLLNAFPTGAPLLAAPGDDHESISTYTPNFFPSYSSVLAFAEKSTGAGTAEGYKASAFRFVAETSGPMEYIQVALYAPGGSGNEPSARVAIYADAGGKKGGLIRAFTLSSIDVGNFRGYFAYHNYEQLGPDETALILTKGQAYWIAVEPLNDHSYAYWAQSYLKTTTKAERNEAGVLKFDDRASPPYVLVNVFEPFPPQVQSPGVPLVEGEQVPGEAQGVTLESVGVVPQTPSLGKIATGRARTSVLLGSDGKVKLRVGEPAPQLAGATIASLGEPSGDAVVATLVHHSSGNSASDVTAANDSILIGGIRTATFRLIARTGQAIDGGDGSTIRKFVTIDGDGSSVFFLAQLAGAGVSGKNDLALAAAPAGGPAHILVRENDPFGSATVQVIGTLAGLTGTLGEGRWRADGDHLGVRLTLSNRSSLLATIPASATSQADWAKWAATGTQLSAPAGAVLKTIGAPGFGPDGVVFPATLELARGGPSKADDAVLLQQTAAGLTLLAVEGDQAPDREGVPMADATFKTFGNPVHGPSGMIAFTATLKAKANTSGVWWVDGSNPLRLLVRAGDPAPTLGAFSTFTDLVFPNATGSTPIFKAALKPQAAASVSAATDAGIWGVNHDGQVALLVRDGGYVYLNDDLFGTLSGITALATAAGSSGSAHGIDPDGALRIDGVITSASHVKKRVQFSIPIPQP